MYIIYNYNLLFKIRKAEWRSWALAGGGGGGSRHPRNLYLVKCDGLFRTLSWAHAVLLSLRVR